MIQNKIAAVEQFLNPLDRIPVLGSFSGMVRILAGMVQMIAGVALAYFKTIFLLISSSKFSFQKGVNEGMIQFTHSILNLIRGSIAMLSGVNLLLFVYDYKIGRFNYPDEIVKHGIYPIATAWRIAPRSQIMFLRS